MIFISILCNFVFGLELFICSYLCLLDFEDYTIYVLIVQFILHKPPGVFLIGAGYKWIKKTTKIIVIHCDLHDLCDVWVKAGKGDGNHNPNKNKWYRNLHNLLVRISVRLNKINEIGVGILQSKRYIGLLLLTRCKSGLVWSSKVNWHYPNTTREGVVHGRLWMNIGQCD